MRIPRRDFLAATGATLVFAASGRAASQENQKMYGLIGKMMATPGQRDALASILVEGVGGMPGCLSYIVATDPSETDALWITEVWDSEASHAASLKLPAVQDAIARGRPLIAGFGQRTVTAPVGGHGLVRANG